MPKLGRPTPCTAQLGLRCPVCAPRAAALALLQGILLDLEMHAHEAAEAAAEAALKDMGSGGVEDKEGAAWADKRQRWRGSG